MAIVQRSLNITYPPLFNDYLENGDSSQIFILGMVSFTVYNIIHVLKVFKGVKTSAHYMRTLIVYRASVQTILFSKWSRVSPLGQAPISISLNTMCRPPPLIDAASIRGKVASQSVQKRILRTENQRQQLLLMAVTLLWWQSPILNTELFDSFS